ncbi:MAG: 30S ribosomal protein S12 methylthiotransferase RimO [Firmicutes bacterium]|nr:30S ribosomal protein S12 methylthiotransferase RimO [Bacillota bacterium]
MKIYIETLGCPKNTVDSENMAALLEKNEHSIITSPEEADMIIVNTCGFINDAKVESIDTIFEMAQLKDENPDLILAMSGCLSQRYADSLYDEMPEVDLFLGVNDYDKINDIIAELENKERLVNVSHAPAVYCEIPERKTEEGAFTAYLRISEGCDNVCSYCVIPSIRGGFRSRKKEDIIAEANMLAGRGVKELVIIAQDVTAYGKDIYGGYVLHELLTELCKIDGIHWIRLLYCYEDSITDELIEVIKNEDKICKYLDIPLQHISDEILYNMNRHSTTESVKNTIRRLRREIPDIHIRTTFIVGFPGERQAHFDELEEFVAETRFDRMGVFAYSKEEGTVAAEMKGQVRESTKERRQDILMSLQREISLAKNEEKIGQTLEVLVDEKCDDGTYMGRTQYDAPDIDNGVIFTSDRELEPGQFIKVTVTDAFDYDLTGKESL